MSTHLTLAFYIPEPAEFQKGMRFFEILDGCAPDLSPQKFGNHQPLKIPFEHGRSNKLRENWRWPFFWTRVKPRVNGCVLPSPPKVVHSSFEMVMQFTSANAAKSRLVLEEVSKQFCPDFAFLHPYSEADQARGSANSSLIVLQKGKNYYVSVPAWVLGKFIPDLYQITIFGTAYVGHFGLKKLLSAPAASVKQLTESCVCIQLLDSLTDRSDGLKILEETRAAVKKHLGEDSFFDAQKGPTFAYATPKFVENRFR